MRSYKYIIKPCLTLAFYYLLFSLLTLLASRDFCENVFLVKYAYYSVKKLPHLCPSYNFYSLLRTLQTVYQSMS